MSNPIGVTGNGDLVFSKDWVPVEIHECASASPTGIALCLAGWNEMFRKGLTDGRLAFHSGMSMIVANAGNGRDCEPVGVILFGIEPEFKRCWITLSYVKEEHRGNGYYSAMYGGDMNEINENSLETVDAADFWRGFECENCGHVTRQPAMLRSIPRCERCDGGTRGQGFKIRNRK